MLVALACSLTACDPISGVSTDAKLTRPVDLVCIDGALRTVAGAGTVEHRTDVSKSFQILPYRGQVVTVSDAWDYGGDRGGILHLTNDGQAITYSNGRMKMGNPLPKADLDAFVPLMDRVNIAIESKCGLPIRSKAKVSRT